MKNTIIFDLDGTLYPRNNKFFSFLEIKTQNYMMKMKPNLTLEKFEKMEKSIPNLLDALRYLELDKNKFYKDVYEDINYEDFFKEDKKLKNMLENINTINLIVTMSANRQVEEISRLLGIDKYIERGYSPEQLDINSKEEIYIKILKEYCISPKNCFVIGDDYEIDIEPAIRLGINNIYITNKQDTKDADFVVKNIYEALNIIK